MNLQPRKSHLIAVAVCMAIVLGAASSASACPSCQAALDADGSQGDLARGMYYSILFMLSMPFAIVGTFAGLMYRAVKRERRRQAALTAEQGAAPASDLPKRP